MCMYMSCGVYERDSVWAQEHDTSLSSRLITGPHSSNGNPTQHSCNIPHMLYLHDGCVQGSYHPTMPTAYPHPHPHPHPHHVGSPVHPPAPSPCLPTCSQTAASCRTACAACSPPAHIAVGMHVLLCGCLVVVVVCGAIVRVLLQVTGGHCVALLQEFHCLCFVGVLLFCM